MADGYRGLFGAFPYAFRRTDSWLCRSYVVVGTLAAALLTLLFGFGLVVIFGKTLGFGGGSLTLLRAFYVVVGLFAVAPVIAPVLLVARRHRRETPAKPGYDAALAAAGYLFLLALYAGVVASMPETFTLDGETVARPPPAGLFAPVVALLCPNPPTYSMAVPLSAAGVMGVVHRLRS
jgi:hypothetical protein